MNIKLTIGVCVKNSEDGVKVALRSIAKQDFPHKLMKLIVVDDGSEDDTLFIVKGFISKIDIKIVVYSSGGKGLGASRQIVVERAMGDYIVWIDADLMLRTNFIRKHVEFMEKNPSIGAASPKRIASGKRTIVSILESMNALLVNPNPKAIGTGGAIFRIKALRQIGGFDINIKGAGEDQDVSHRIRMSGWQLSRNSSSELYHTMKGTWKSLWDRHFWYGYGTHFLFHKYKMQMSPWEHLPPIALVIGFKNSRQIYDLTHEKKFFVLAPLYYLFRSIARSCGFIRAHLACYGHTVSNES